MSTERARKSLDEYLALDYPFNVIASADGGYVIEFPDLPGCLTQVDDPNEIVPMAMDAKRTWIEGSYELGWEIPPPSYPEEYSGRFVLRMPKRLHRELAEAAKRNGVSLNTWVVYLLSGKLVAERGKGRKGPATKKREDAA